jgi:hypothetical protein
VYFLHLPAELCKQKVHSLLVAADVLPRTGSLLGYEAPAVLLISQQLAFSKRQERIPSRQSRVAADLFSNKKTEGLSEFLLLFLVIG